MADKKPSGFRFRLPWLQQAPTPTPAREQPNQSPRTTPQTSIASTSAQRPPFRPPGKAAPSIVATSALASPRQSAPQSVPKSPISETIKPLATQHVEENQTTTETVKTTVTTPAKETQSTTETIPTIETVGPTTLPQTPPRQAQSQQPSPPQSPPQFRLPSLLVSPTRIRTPPQANSQPRSPSRMATPTKHSSLSSPETSPPRATFQPSLPVHDEPSPTHTPLRSPSRLASPPTDIKRSTEITKVKGRRKPITASTQAPLPREIKDDLSKFIQKIVTTSASKQSPNEQPASVITVAGDNKGAFMHLNSDAMKKDIKQDTKLSENEETKEIVNSNVQGINNSMLFNSSVTVRNPGVHLVITRNLATKMNDLGTKNAESMEMPRAEFNPSPPQKLVYDPTIGRSLQDDYGPDDFETSANGYEIEVL